jgi:PAS domain S-box-containing protein
MKILIVDDIVDNLYVLEALLKGMGYNTYMAHNGIEALEILEKTEIDVIISDILMPKMDGFQLCFNVKTDEKLSEIPFVFYTATYTTEKDKKFALDLGADKFILKPAEPEIIVKEVRDLIMKKNEGKFKIRKPTLDKDNLYFKEYNLRLVAKLEHKISELDKSQELFRSVFESTSDAIITYDPEGIILNANNAALQLFAYTQNEIIGEHMSLLASDELIQEQIEVLKKLKKVKSSSHFETNRKTKDKRLIPVEISVSVMLNKAGDEIGFTSIYRDITERKKVEIALKNSEERYRLIFNNAPDALFISDLKGYTIDGNRELEKLLKLNREDIIDKNFFKLDFLPKNQLTRGIKLLAKALIADINKPELFIINRRDGSKVFMELKVHRINIWGKTHLLGIARDITERKKTEKEIENHRNHLEEIVKERTGEIKKLSLAVEYSPVSVVITDKAGQIEYVNPKYTEITGYTLEETQGNKPNILASGKTSKKVFENLWNTILSGKEWNGELINKRKNGELFYENVFIAPIMNELNEITHFLALKEDITKNKEAEILKEQNEIKLKKQFEIISKITEGDIVMGKEFTEAIKLITEEIASGLEIQRTGVWKMNSDKSGIECLDLYKTHNLQHSNGFELKVEDFPSYFKSLLSGNFIDASNARTDKRTSEFNKHYLEPNNIYSMLDVPVWLNGKVYGVMCCEHTGSVKKWTTEDLNFAMAMANQITLILETNQRKNALDELAIETERLTLATNVSNIGIWDWDVVQNKLIWDELMYKIYKVKKDKFAGVYDAWLERLHPDEAEKSNFAMKNALKGIKEYDIEFQIVHDDGAIRVIKAKAKVYRDKDGKPVRMIGTNMDVTKQKELESELIKAKEKAELATDAKSGFLANMSHEIRTPMNAILGFSEILSSSITDPIQKDYIESINSSGKLLLNLINDILDFSKIEAGKIELQNDPANISFILNDLTKMFEIKSIEKGIKFIPETSIDSRLNILIDELKLKQVLINLINNAIKFTDSGFVYLKVKVQEKSKYHVNLYFSVEDTGIGIAKKDHKRVLKAFNQTEDIDSKKYKGTGLGLAISKKFIEKMGGELKLDSTLNVGTQFSFTLKNIALAETQTQAKQEPVIIPETIQFKNSKILIIDDVQSNHDLLIGYLKPWNLQLFHAYDGKQGIKLALDIVADIIFLDIRMPVMDGYEAIKKIKGNNKLKKIPVIAVTASSYKNEKEKILKAGFNNYLIKPFQLIELIALLTNHLPYKKKKIELKQTTNNLELTELDIPELIKPEFINDFNNEALPIWNSIKARRSQKLVSDFSTKLQEQGQKYNSKNCMQYGTALKMANDSFNVEKVLLLLQLFKKFESNLKNKNE